MMLMCPQTRVYEKLRFARVRQSQLNGEDVRDRWHNVLKNLDDDVEIDPEEVKIKVRPYRPVFCLRTDRDFQNAWLYPFDAEADTLKRWQEVSAEVGKELQDGRVKPLFEDVSALYALEAH